jgi:hypothetical protein
MPRKQRNPKPRVERLEVPPAVRFMLETGELPIPSSAGYQLRGRLECFSVHEDPDWLRTRWEAARDEILADWILRHPGTKPHAWWLFDAPRTTQGALRRSGE